jgi:ribose transport system permease protein
MVSSTDDPGASNPEPTTDTAELSRWRSVASRISLRSTGVLIPLLAVIVMFTILSPRFLTTLNIQNVLIQASALAILAYGSTLVIVTEEIDLSVGAIEGFTAIIAGIVAVRAGIPWPLAVVAALVAGLILGAMNGVITAMVGVPSFITTLAMLGIATGLGSQMTNGESIYNFPTGYQTIGQGKLAGIAVPVLIALALLIVLHLMLRRTRTGLNIYAVGGNRHAAAMVGVSPTKIKILAFSINGLCAGLAGVVVTAKLNSANPTFGANDLLNAIAAVVIGGAALTGGIGSMIGTTLGVLLIVTITNGLTLLGVSPFWQQAAIGGIILTAAVMDRLNRRRAA